MNNIKKFKFNKRIWINFEWWSITWNAGLLIIHEFLRKMNVEKLLEKYIPDTRIWGYEHLKQEIIYQKILRIIAWYPSNNSYEHLKEDPVFQEIHNWKIASPSTCSRLENTFNFTDVEKLKKVQKEIEKANIKQSNTKEIILDLDTTKDPCSENIEWSSYVPHYEMTWYSPLLAFNWLNWDIISGILKPWRFHCSTFSITFVKSILEFYHKNWVKNIHLRWDSAFPNEDMMWLCEKEEVYYYFKLKTYDNLVKMVEKEWIRWRSIFVEIEHKATDWKKSRRIIACIDWVSRETEESKVNRKKNPKLKKLKQLDLFPVYSFIVTNNLALSKEEIFSMYTLKEYLAIEDQQ